MRTKTNKFFLVMSASDYDVVILTETWLRDDIADSELAADYVIYRCDRNSNTSEFGRGGGVLIAVKRNLSCTLLPLSGYEHLEQVAVQIKLSGQSLYICSIYLRPDSDTNNYIAHAEASQQLLDMAPDFDRVIVVGDYNLPHLTWVFDDDLNSFIPTNASSEQETALTESMFASGLHQLCSVTNANNRSLDLAFSNAPDNIEILEAPLPILREDPHHRPFVLYLDARVSIEGEQQQPVDELDFDFKQCNFDEVCVLLGRVNWHELLTGCSLDTAVESFYSVSYDILRQNVPLKRRTTVVHKKHAWWNQ